MAVPLATLAAMVLLGVALFLFIVWFLLPLMDSQVCPGCASRRPLREQACALCGTAMPGPVERHPGAAPYGFPEAVPRRRASVPRIEKGVAFNRGITKRVVTVATAAMAFGIGLRVLGMLGALGYSSLAIPVAVDGLLTVVGGVVAFVGFVFLDAA